MSRSSASIANVAMRTRIAHNAARCVRTAMPMRLQQAAATMPRAHKTSQKNTYTRQDTHRVDSFSFLSSSLLLHLLVVLPLPSPFPCSFLPGWFWRCSVPLTRHSALCPCFVVQLPVSFPPPLLQPARVGPLSRLDRMPAPPPPLMMPSSRR